MAKVPLTDPAPGLPSAWRGWYVVTVLSIASIVSFIDRQIINLLVDPINLTLAIAPVGMMMIGVALIIIARGPFWRNAVLDGAVGININSTP